MGKEKTPRTILITGRQSPTGRRIVLIDDVEVPLTYGSFLMLTMLVAAKIRLTGKRGAIYLDDFNVGRHNVGRYLYRLRKECGTGIFYTTDKQGNYRLLESVNVGIDYETMQDIGDNRIAGLITQTTGGV